MPAVVRLCSCALMLAVLGCAQHRPDPRSAGAAATDAALGEDFKLAKRNAVPMYSSGPQQIGVPDAYLDKAKPVRVVRSSFGYSLVQTEDGRLGWVASEELVSAGEANRLAETPSSPAAKTGDSAIVAEYTLPSPTPTPKKKGSHAEDSH